MACIFLPLAHNSTVCLKLHLHPRIALGSDANFGFLPLDKCIESTTCQKLQLESQKALRLPNTLARQLQIIDFMGSEIDHVLYKDVPGFCFEQLGSTQKSPSIIIKAYSYLEILGKDHPRSYETYHLPRPFSPGFNFYTLKAQFLSRTNPIMLFILFVLFRPIRLVLASVPSFPYCGERKRE